ncbi:DUF5610 domain-containing protein [Janthinobacterium sp.]|uniref:DUF5610 domain-containing protein n=1 Tax=Janthinobacterium sp. TaxID=1871054 RepID=UPI00293D31CA|nr:DUF5610 domain-containing protein [Janthinobacterium sp.]
MSIPVSSAAGGVAAAAGANDGGADKVKAKDAAADIAPAEKARLQLNAAILQASVNVSIGAQNEPLALLFKSAITSLNETLQGQFGDNAIENAASQDNTPDGTPDGTAGRIVSLSTGFFDAFKKQHPGEDEGAVLKQFMATIRGGVETGFSESRDILKGLNVLSGDIAGNIDKTYALVQKGYADFEAAHTPKTDGAATASATASTAAGATASVALKPA